MPTIQAQFEEKHYPPFDFIKTLHWSGNHWDDILYFPKDYHAITRAQAFIEENFKTNFSLDELAKQVYLSKFHLLRVFKQHLGISPGMYQMQLRLNEARKLIFKDLSLTEVALELGFSDQAHFTNTFKRYSNGASPRDLRKTAIFYNFTE